MAQWGYPLWFWGLGVRTPPWLKLFCNLIFAYLMYFHHTLLFQTPWDILRRLDIGKPFKVMELPLVALRNVADFWDPNEQWVFGIIGKGGGGTFCHTCKISARPVASMLFVVSPPIFGKFRKLYGEKTYHLNEHNQRVLVICYFFHKLWNFSENWWRNVPEPWRGL